MSSKAAKSTIVKECFGGNLLPQGRGFYVTLELMAISWGVDQVDESKLLLPGCEIEFQRRSHDFVRRLLTDVSGQFVDSLGADGGIADDDVMRELGDLFRGLLVPIPFQAKAPGWFGYHLFPYVGELIHYDAVNSRVKAGEKSVPQVERYLYRGGGTLVYELLRTDPNQGRLKDTRAGIRQLTAASDSSLGKLAAEMASHDFDQPDTVFTDNTVQDHDETRNTNVLEALRSGVHSILTNDRVERARKVDYLSHWVPFCLALHQRELAFRLCDERRTYIPVGITTDRALRAESRKIFERSRRQIRQALVKTAQNLAAKKPEDSELSHLAEGSEKWTNDTQLFFASTLAVIGGLNHNSGRRHFTMKPALVEAVVAALVPEPEGVDFDLFCQSRLFEKLGLVVDDISANKVGLLRFVNGTTMEQNTTAFSNLLADSGLLLSLSDATRLVGLGLEGG